MINIPNVVAKVIPVQAPYISEIIRQIINVTKDMIRKITDKTKHKIPIAGEDQIITKNPLKQKNPKLFTRYKTNIIRIIKIIPASAIVSTAIHTKHNIKSIPITKVDA